MHHNKGENRNQLFMFSYEQVVSHQPKVDQMRQLEQESFNKTK